MDASDVNVLLLGESGVGKSTFINAFANYNQYKDFRLAVASNLVCLIPTSFTIADADYNYTLVQLGEDGNEDRDVGQSATQEPMEYKFQVDEQTVCLIDTPGVGDARGIEQDEKNIRNIIAYIQKFQHLNAICFLLKPNESILSEYFRFCISQLFSCLPKNAAENIVFVFTNTSGTCYRPAETMPMLKKLLTQMRNSPQGVSIPCNIKNVFCVDNEAFRFLVALKRGIGFSEKERNDFSESWKISAECCRRMLQHIVTSLKPHQLEQAGSMQEAKNMVQLLCPLLLTIYVTKEEYAYKLRIYTENSPIKKTNNTTYLNTIYIPKSKKKSDGVPIIVCRNAKCYRMEYNQHVYRQVCHMNCNCISFDKTIRSVCLFNDSKYSYCPICGCNVMDHVPTKGCLNVEPGNTNSVDKPEIMRIRKYQVDLEAEVKSVVETMAKFSHFVNENSMGHNAVNFDIFMENTIKREERLDAESNPQHLKYYRQLQALHAIEKQKLDVALAEAKKVQNDLAVAIVSHEDVRKCMDGLLKLPITGAILSQCTVADDVKTATTKILQPPVDRSSDKFKMVTINDINELQCALTQYNYSSILDNLTVSCKTLIRSMSIVGLVSFVKEYLQQMPINEDGIHNISSDLIMLDSLLTDIDLNIVQEGIKRQEQIKKQDKLKSRQSGNKFGNVTTIIYGDCKQNIPIPERKSVKSTQLANKDNMSQNQGEQKSIQSGNELVKVATNKNDVSKQSIIPNPERTPLPTASLANKCINNSKANEKSDLLTKTKQNNSSVTADSRSDMPQPHYPNIKPELKTTHLNSHSNIHGANSRRNLHLTPSPHQIKIDSETSNTSKVLSDITQTNPPLQEKGVHISCITRSPQAKPKARKQLKNKNQPNSDHEPDVANDARKTEQPNMRSRIKSFTKTIFFWKQ